MQTMAKWVQFLTLKGYTVMDRDWLMYCVTHRAKVVTRMLKVQPPHETLEIAADEVTAAAAEE